MIPQLCTRKSDLPPPYWYRHWYRRTVCEYADITRVVRITNGTHVTTITGVADDAGVMGLTGLALTVRPQVSTVWLGITLFFAVRFATSAGRIFSGRGGFGQWWS